MVIRPISLSDLSSALSAGWRLLRQTRRLSLAYASLFVLAGAAIMGAFLLRGWTPFVFAAAGAFMLLGPVVLAGFFGIAQTQESGQSLQFAVVLRGFRNAAPALWALALVCVLLFMIFVTDAAILYAYMVGDAPVWLAALTASGSGVVRFVFWATVSGGFVALLLFCISVYSVPLLCECRCGLVTAVATSIRAVFSNFWPSLVWAVVLSGIVIGSIFVLPLLAWTLPWMAYAGRDLYRRVLPDDASR